MKLKCYTNHYDWVIGYSEKDAWEVWCEHLGEKREDYAEAQWIELSEDKYLRIEEDTFGVSMTKTVGEWIESHGRGWLCSTEA